MTAGDVERLWPALRKSARGRLIHATMRSEDDPSSWFILFRVDPQRVVQLDKIADWPSKVDQARKAR